ncbi:MAG: L-lactate dehydrogenase [Chloroflexota bacterium]
MKIGIVGSGRVGSTAAYALIMRGIGGRIVMVDMDPARAQAEASDLLHAVPFANPMRVMGGDYAALDGARAVIIAAGVGRSPGQTRLDLLSRNAGIFKEVVPNILKYAPEAILVIATNPVDIMTHLAARYAQEVGASPGQVVGSGTTLDTARFRAILAQAVGVDSRHVHAYVVGEHGDSEVLAWSRVTIGGTPLQEFCTLRNVSLDDETVADIDQRVRFAGRDIIAGKGATFYGIGSALAHIVGTVINDRQSILTVGTPVADVAGVKDVTVSLPHLVGGQGILATFPLPLSQAEHEKLAASAQVVREAIDSLDSAMAG